MNKTLTLALPFILGAAACASAAPPAHAGEWRLNPRLCPDLREDVRDARVVTGRRDLREDRRDRRVVTCPASAYVWVGDNVRVRPARPTYRTIYVGPRGRYYARRNGKDVRIRVVVR
ncbi:MAG: hypothetical protein ACWA5T_11870 [Parvularcula sp.]